MVHQVQSAEEFQQMISENSTVVVDFFANWCGPCVFIAPEVDKLSQKYTDVKFIKVDVDVLGELAAQYGISSIPTFFIFKDGKVADKMSGASKDRLEQLINQHK